MASRLSRFLTAATVVAIVGSPATGAAWPMATTAQSGQPGPLNAITDVPGLQVGQVQSTRPPYLTGTTVLYAPSGPVAGVSVRGGAPDSWETDLLKSTSAAPGVQAIVLTGGSAYGLNVAGGVLRWLEQRGAPVPIAPGAAIHDLGNGGDASARPTAAWGYQAINAAAPGPVRQGSVGGGTGAIAGALKGGIGTASVRLEQGIVVGALVVVNTAGSAVDPRTCSLLGASHAVPHEFAGLSTPAAAECPSRLARHRSVQAQRTSTHTAETTERTSAIAVVATNASLRHAAVTRMAAAAQDGMAQAITPVPARQGGNTVFALATGTGPKVTGSDRTSAAVRARIDRAGADALSRAIAHAMLAATSTATIKSYCDTYPSACGHLHPAHVGTTLQVQPDRAQPGGIRPVRGTHPRQPVSRLLAAAQSGNCTARHGSLPPRQSVLPATALRNGAARWLKKLVEWVANHTELHGHTTRATGRQSRAHTATSRCRTTTGPAAKRVAPRL